MALKDMESDEEANTGGKPILIRPPSRHESPGHRVLDMSHVPLCDIAMLYEVSMQCGTPWYAKTALLYDRLTPGPK